MLDRFRDVAIHATSQATFLVALHGVGSQRNDERMSAARFFFFADQSGRFKTIHLGHLHIHQNHVEGLLLRCFQRFSSILRQYHAVPPLL